MEPYSQEATQRSNAELKLDDSTDFLTPDTPDSLQPVSNAVKIDRYIVKYKNNREAQFLDKAGSILERSETLTPCIELMPYRRLYHKSMNYAHGGPFRSPWRSIKRDY